MRILIAALFFASAFFSQGAAATCLGWDKSWPEYHPDYYSVRLEYRRALYIVEVRSLKETWLDEDGKPKPLEPPFQNGADRPWGFDPYGGALYEVEVLRTFKGKPPRRLTLFSENSTARFHLAVGEKYLLFVTHHDSGLIGQHFGVDTCGNSGDLARATKTIRALRKLSASPPRPQ